MKRLCISLLLLPLLSILLVSQVQLALTGSASDGSIVSGEVLSWQISGISPGDTVHNELWLDLNGNSVLDPSTDKQMFLFDQVDGAPGDNGPGDDDGMANGMITTAFPAGLAPARWIFVVKHESGNVTAPFEVTHLASPAATITGTITVPSGYSKANFIIEANTQSGSSGPMNPFWHGMTDVNGNYTIEIGTVGGSPASLNPWRVGLSGGDVGFGRLVPVRKDTLVNLGGSTPVVNFAFLEGTILMGRVLNQNLQPILNADPHTHDASNINGSTIGGRTNGDGYFAFAVPSGTYKLHFTARGYFDAWYDGQQGFDNATQIVVTTQDTIRNLNATMTQAGIIEGQVRNYGSPVNAQVTIFTTDSNQVWSTGTHDQGLYDVTLSPGTYVVRFEYMGVVQYYDHTWDWPGNSVTITGTEIHSNIDADFMVGEVPPMNPPSIMNIWDVPFDNGRQVYIKWQGIDRMYAQIYGPLQGVTSYSIERQDGPNWVYLRSVPTAMDDDYTTIVPTLRDSTKTEGMFVSTFRVRAHFGQAAGVLNSQPASGYSLDNLAPAVPGGVGSVVNGSDVVLRWNADRDEDLKYYSVYRSTTPGFSISGLAPYGYTAVNEYVDPGAATGTFYYRMTATDHAGNESDPSIIVTSSGTTITETVETLPTSYSLHQNYPNPFNPSTEISFDLPSQAHVRIVVYNTLGEQVAVVLDAVRPAGTHSATFQASALPSGIYVCRMQADNFTATMKMSLLK